MFNDDVALRKRLVSAELCWNDDYNCAIVVPSYFRRTRDADFPRRPYISVRLQNISRVYTAETRRDISCFIRFSAFPPAVKYPLRLCRRKRVVIFSGASCSVATMSSCRYYRENQRPVKIKLKRKHEKFYFSLSLCDIINFYSLEYINMFSYLYYIFIMALKWRIRWHVLAILIQSEKNRFARGRVSKFSFFSSTRRDPI